MSLEQLGILAALVVQTGTFVWWAATLTVVVKQHERKLEDHEERLREGKL